MLRDFDANQFKQELITKIKDATGKDVSIENIGLAFHLKSGLALSASNVSYEDIFPGADFQIHIKNVLLNLNLTALWMRREVVASQIIIKMPAISLKMKSPDNKAQTSEPDDTNMLESPHETNKEISSESKIAPPPFRINKLQVVDGTVDIIITSDNQKQTVPIKDIDLLVKNFNFKEPFEIYSDCSLWSRQKNIQMKGNMSLDITQKTLELSDVILHSDLDRYSITKIEQSLPQLSKFIEKSHAQGTLTVRIHQLLLNENGLMTLKAESKLSDGTVQLHNYPYAFDRIRYQVDATEEKINIAEIFSTVSSGTINITGAVKNYMNRPKYTMSIKMKDISLREIIQSVQDSIDFDGTLNGMAHLYNAPYPQGSGTYNLKGGGGLSVANGKLIGINILKIILDKMSMIPGLTEKLNQNLPENYKSQIKNRDTLFEEIDMEFIVINDRVSFPKLELISDAFAVTGTGWVNVSQHMGLKGALTVPQDLSKSMVDASEELYVLLDSNGQIKIPLREYNGPIENFRPIPDVEYLFRNALEQKGKQELRKLLNKALGRDGDEEGSQNGDLPPDNNSGQEEKSPEEQIIENIFDTIFQ